MAGHNNKEVKGKGVMALVIQELMMTLPRE